MSSVSELITFCDLEPYVLSHHMHSLLQLHIVGTYNKGLTILEFSEEASEFRPPM